MFIHDGRFHNLALRLMIMRVGVLCVCSLLAGCGVQMFLRVERRAVDERVVYFLGGGGNSLALLHRGGALLVDTKLLGMAQTLKAQVEVDLAHQVQRILLTHSHQDHVGGLKLYPEAGAVVVHPNTRRRLEASGQRAPWVEVEREIQLTLGGEKVRIMYLGVGHTDGDLVALLEGHRLLVTGDLMTDGYEPLIDVSAGGDALAFRHTLDALLSLDFDTALPGHGEPMKRVQVERVRDYLVAVEQAVRAAMARGLAVEAVVAEVTLPEFKLEAMPFGASRDRTVRRMFESLSR